MAVTLRLTRLRFARPGLMLFSPTWTRNLCTAKLCPQQHFSNENANILSMPSMLNQPVRLLHGEPEKQAEAPAHAAVDEPQKPAVPLSRAQKLQVMVAQYGSVVMVFHISMSLTSLGLMYVAVSAGLDVVWLASKAGFDISGSVASSASTFAVAYIAHKVLAPARLAITAVSVPVIVSYLRNLGYLRKTSPAKPSEGQDATPAASKADAGKE